MYICIYIHTYIYIYAYSAVIFYNIEEKKTPSSRSRTSDLRMSALAIQLQSSALPTELSKGYMNVKIILCLKGRERIDFKCP